MTEEWIPKELREKIARRFAGALRRRLFVCLNSTEGTEMHLRLAEKIVRTYVNCIINPDRCDEKSIERELAGFELLALHPCFMILLDGYIAEAMEEAIDTLRDELLKAGFDPDEMIKSFKEEQEKANVDSGE